MSQSPLVVRFTPRTRTSRSGFSIRRRALLKGTQDYYGNSTQLIRDDKSRVVKIYDDLGRTTRIGYMKSGHIARVVDFGGGEVLLDYDSSGHLERITRPGETWAASNDVDYVYGAGGRITEVKDTAGRVILKNTYDVQGRVVAQRNAHNMSSGNAIGITYDQTPVGFDVVEVVDALGATAVYAHADSSPGNLQWVERRSDLDVRGAGSSFPGNRRSHRMARLCGD